MLTIEEIKKGAKLAEGFDVDIAKNRAILDFPDGQWTYLDYPNELFQTMIYSLFLQRVIEGIKIKYKKQLLSIIICYEILFIFIILI
jgi:hypothetical protein